MNKISEIKVKRSRARKGVYKQRTKRTKRTKVFIFNACVLYVVGLTTYKIGQQRTKLMKKEVRI